MSTSSPGAIEAWRGLDRTTGEARLYPLAQFMVDVYAAALLLEQAGWEQEELGSDRKALVARLYVREHLADRGPLRGIDAPAEELSRFKDLVGRRVRRRAVSEDRRTVTRSGLAPDRERDARRRRSVTRLVRRRTAASSRISPALASMKSPASSQKCKTSDRRRLARSSSTASSTSWASCSHASPSSRSTDPAARATATRCLQNPPSLPIGHVQWCSTPWRPMARRTT